MKLLKRNLFALSFMLISSIACFNTAFAADGKDALFNELGGKAGLTKIVDDFMPLVMADTRINRFFEKTDQTKLKAMLVDHAGHGDVQLHRVDVSALDTRLPDFSRERRVKEQALLDRG